MKRQAAENALRWSQLEEAIEEDERSQQLFQRLLAESEQGTPAAEQAGHAGQLNLTGRRRALEGVQGFVTDKLIRLKQALEEEGRRRLELEQEVAANAQRRTELEAALEKFSGCRPPSSKSWYQPITPNGWSPLSRRWPKVSRRASGWPANWKRRGANWRLSDAPGLPGKPN